MAGYRFCRPDDIPLLIEAVNRCYHSQFPANVPDDLDSFKRDVRERDLWASSCMIAYEGDDLIGVLIGCKRKHASLIHRLGIHPDFQRQGHGRHLVTSLSGKLAVLGPPRIIAEVPTENLAACALFRVCGFQQTGEFSDLVFRPKESGSGVRALVTQVTFNVAIEQDLVPSSALTRAGPWDISAETIENQRENLAVALLVPETEVLGGAIFRHMKGQPEILRVWCNSQAEEKVHTNLLLSGITDMLNVQNILVRGVARDLIESDPKINRSVTIFEATAIKS